MKNIQKRSVIAAIVVCAGAAIMACLLYTSVDTAADNFIIIIFL